MPAHSHWVFDFDRFILIATLGAALLGVLLTWWYGHRQEQVGHHGEMITDEELQLARYLGEHATAKRSMIKGSNVLIGPGTNTALVYSQRLEDLLRELRRKDFLSGAPMQGFYGLSKDGRAVVRANRRRRLKSEPLASVTFD